MMVCFVGVVALTLLGPPKLPVKDWIGESLSVRGGEVASNPGIPVNVDVLNGSNIDKSCGIGGGVPGGSGGVSALGGGTSFGDSIQKKN